MTGLIEMDFLAVNYFEIGSSLKVWQIADPDPAYFTRARRLFKKAFILTPPTPSAPRRAFPQARPNEVRDAKNNEAYGAMKKERHVCARRRIGDWAVSRERPVS
jgi:hypothetical protein